jgi:predicted Zn finger-like uncharacterized protein
MNVVCSQCNLSYTIADSKIPAQRAFFNCKRCGLRIYTGPAAVQEAALVRKPDPPSPRPASHDRALLDSFPEAAAFAPQRYALAQLLAPDKKGRIKTRLNKLVVKLLTAVQPALDRMLEDGEQVMCVAGGTAYYPIEIFFGNGWLTTLYNRYVLVATDRRLVAVNTDYKMRRPAHYFFQFPFNEMKKVSRGIFGTSLTLTRTRGKRRVFTAIKSPLAKQMKAYLAQKIAPQPLADPAAAPRDNLCPGCFTPLSAKLDACPHCRVIFKSPRKAALRSLMLPGLGDIYLGHRFLGILEMLGSAVMWVVILALLLGEGPSQLGFVIFMGLIYFGMDGLLTLHMAKKGYSLESEPTPAAVAGQPSLSRV